MAEFKRVTALRKRAFEFRCDLLKLCYKANGLHVAGDLSLAELLTELFSEVICVRPDEPSWEDRDRVVLSKGHSSAALYICMANKGYFDKEELFATYKSGYETRFGNHPCKSALSCLDTSSGSLGHGLPIAVGMAVAGRLDRKDYRVFCILGDGEIAEGSIWEAALAGAGYKLGNLVAIIDRNGLGLDGFTEEIMPLDPIEDKWKAFNWNVVSIDGHDAEQVIDAFDHLPSPASEVPTVIIANTVKGKGVSYMENNPLYHHASIDAEQLEQALMEVRETYIREGGVI